MPNPLFARKPLSVLLAEVKGENRLRRVLGPVQLTSLGVGAVIGAGIFVSTGATARQTAGPALMLSYCVAGLVCIFAALCYAEFSAMVPVAGSAYTYAYATLGELFAWIIGWDLVLEYAVSAATVADGWSGYFQSLLDVFGWKLPHAIAGPVVTYSPQLGKLIATGSLINLPALAIVALVTVVLVVGIQESARANTVLVAIKLAAVLFVIAVGAFYVNPANWHPFAPYGLTGLQMFGHMLLGRSDAGGQPLGMLAGAALAFFAYIGFDSVSTHSEEAKNPQRDVPLGIIVSLILCTLLYIGVVAVLTGMVPYGELDVNAPVADAFRRVGLRWAQFLIAAAGLAGITSVLLVTMLSQARILLAIARDGLLPPSFFAAVHDRFRTPWKSTIVTGLFVASLAAFLPISVLLLLVNMGTLFAFVIVCAAVLIMRRTHPEAERPFRVPWVPVLPILGILSCLLLMFSLPSENWLRLFVWLAIGLIIYFAYGRRHSALARSQDRLEADRAKGADGMVVKTLLMILCLVGMMAPIARGQQPPPPDAERLRKMAEIVNRPVLYSVPGMDQVTVRKDLVFTKSDDPNIKMDVYLPPGLKAGEKRPAVIFLHGGAPPQYRPKEWGFFQSWGRLVAASGMVGVTFTYRQGFPQTMSLASGADVAAAIAYVREHADTLGVDKDRLAVAAYSSGGAMLSPYLHGAPPYIRCALGFYPFLDIRQSEAFKASETPETLDRFSPLVQIATGTGRFTPLFVTQGGKDEIPTLKDSVDRFVAEALVRGVPLTFLFHPDAPHAFDNQIDDDRTREILKGALEFLQWHLKRGKRETARASPANGKTLRTLEEIAGAEGSAGPET